MTDKFEHKPERIPTPSFIYAVCTLGVLGTLPTLLLWTTEVAYMVGQWYLNFLLISTLLIWLSLVGIWKMKKWAVFAYTIIIIVTHVTLFKYNVLWNYTSLIIPAIVSMTMWFYFKRMT
jgi:hypothetical protein